MADCGAGDYDSDGDWTPRTSAELTLSTTVLVTGTETPPRAQVGVTRFTWAETFVTEVDTT